VKLQLALDHTSTAAALALLEKTADLIDIAEAGTPLLMAEGTRAVTEIRRHFPSLIVLADLKIMDAGGLEAGIGFDAGAKIVTVLAAAEEATLRRACQAARAAGGEVMVDLIGVRGAAGRAAGLLEAGADYLCCHTAYDVQGQGRSPLEALRRLRSAVPAAPLAAAGGITAERLPELLPYGPEIVIVGGYVSAAEDPRAALQAVRSRFPPG
jgi:3-hexulose-6-phosphate synthase